MRPSNFPTLEAALAHACPAARKGCIPLCIIADQPEDGGFAVTVIDGADQDDVYMNIDRNGDASEGRKARTLPIGFTGALPH